MLFYKFYALIALHPILPRTEYIMLSKFVSIVQIACLDVLTTTDDLKLKNYIKQFIDLFEETQGKDKVTPNIHLHLHLNQIIKQFGPFHGSWCFNFER